TIIKGIFSEGQLDESELTFKDLHKLSENFLRILTGIFHQRIAYPDSTNPKAPGSIQSAPQAPPKPVPCLKSTPKEVEEFQETQLRR
ncbi:MAG: HD family phosphohydrolase, partial [Desulfovibrionaceae bacterium]|nr:HD family phosphohydrolase [Desulfovibrionaceae bacterium]